MFVPTRVAVPPPSGGQLAIAYSQQAARSESRLSEHGPGLAARSLNRTFNTLLPDQQPSRIIPVRRSAWRLSHCCPAHITNTSYAATPLDDRGRLAASARQYGRRNQNPRRLCDQCSLRWPAHARRQLINPSAPVIHAALAVRQLVNAGGQDAQPRSSPAAKCAVTFGSAPNLHYDVRLGRGKSRSRSLYLAHVRRARWVEQLVPT